MASARPSDIAGTLFL